jgi:hypothetical protein
VCAPTLGNASAKWRLCVEPVTAAPPTMLAHVASARSDAATTRSSVSCIPINNYKKNRPCPPAARPAHLRHDNRLECRDGYFVHITVEMLHKCQTHARFAHTHDPQHFGHNVARERFAWQYAEICNNRSSARARAYRSCSPVGR